ncbi:hypothetical protein SLA2020_256960 [Shorea laevis]
MAHLETSRAGFARQCYVPCPATMSLLPNDHSRPSQELALLLPCLWQRWRARDKRGRWRDEAGRFLLGWIGVQRAKADGNLMYGSKSQAQEGGRVSQSSPIVCSSWKKTI